MKRRFEKVARNLPPLEHPDIDAPSNPEPVQDGSLLSEIEWGIKNCREVPHAISPAAVAELLTTVMAELLRVTTALEDKNEYQSEGARFILKKLRGWRERAEAAERDLAALRESHAQALREAFDAAGLKTPRGDGQTPLFWYAGRWYDSPEEAFAAYLASRDGGTAG